MSALRTPFLNYGALIPNDIDKPSKLLILHNRNEEVNIPKDDNLQAWKREFVIPWGPLFDLFIVLLYIFFALTYQSSKILFYLNYQSILDNYFIPSDDDDEISYIYYKSNLIDSVNSTAYNFFNFAITFPTQDNFSQDSPLFVSIETEDDEDEFIITESNISYVYQQFLNISDQLKSASISMDYLITRITETEFFYTSITYTVNYDQVDELGLYEISSDLVGTANVENSNFLTINNLTVRIFPYTLVIVDIFAILLTLARFISFFRHAREHAQKNYVTLYRALYWKMDRFEIFNLSYQLLTLISILLYIKYVNNDFGRHRFLLFLVASAGFFHSIGLFMHLRLKRETWFVAQLIFRSLSRTLLFVFGFIPFYISWAFMGLSFFGYFSELFTGFLRSLKILFSMMHTDVCMDTQDQLNEHAAEPNWVIVCYVSSWLCLTGGMVINILISIVENTLEEMIIEEG